MNAYTEIFTGKKITQMGLGLLGRGVGDATFLAKHGAKLCVTDMKDENALRSSLDTLAPYTNITFHLGGHHEEDFKEKDMVLKGAGVPFDSPYIDTARKGGVPVDMSASLFARIARIPMVGVTGTRGKSTVTHLVADILRVDNRDVVVGGNVKGVSNLALLETVQPDSMGVFELDSWQCQGFGEEASLSHPSVRQGAHSPEVAVFTTFMPDHVNYYRGDIERYCADKANIFLHQHPDDTLIIGEQALPALEPYKRKIRAHVVVAREEDLPRSWKVQLLGAHNRYNIAVAIAVARAVGVDDTVIRETVEHAQALPGRLACIGEAKGVRIYNDTNATTPEATISALRALDEDGEKRVVLIAGGTHKDLAVENLAREIEAHTHACVLIPGNGTDELCNVLPETNYTVALSLEDAVRQAFQKVKEGDALLFSPAFASFGMFTNEYDRGEKFNQCIAHYM